MNESAAMPLSDRAFILEHCQRIAAPLVPEVPLLLARDARGIWQEAEEHAGLGPLLARPFWAFAWPGGQLLARVLLDQPEFVRGKSVLDLGAGSGLAAIAAAKAGAARVRAIDVDRICALALALNAEDNGVVLEAATGDVLNAEIDGFDTILLADVAYEPALLQAVSRCIGRALAGGATVLYADRITAALPEIPAPRGWRTLATEAVPVVPSLEEGQLETARVLTIG